MMETRVVEVARVRALVNSVHIMALKARLRAKKVYTGGGVIQYGDGKGKWRVEGDVRHGLGIRQIC